MQQERRFSETDLGERPFVGEIPHDGGNHVPPGGQTGRQIDRFEVPVQHIAAGRPRRDRNSVDVEPITAIGRNVHDKSPGCLGQPEFFPEMTNAVGAVLHAGRRNPPGRPPPRKEPGIDLRLPVPFEPYLGPNGTCTDQRQTTAGRFQQKGRKHSQKSHFTKLFYFKIRTPADHPAPDRTPIRFDNPRKSGSAGYVPVSGISPRRAADRPTEIVRPLAARQLPAAA